MGGVAINHKPFIKNAYKKATETVLATSNNHSYVIPTTGDAAPAINNALQYNMVVTLDAGVTSYQIYSTVVIPEGKTLVIPAGTKVTYKGSAAAAISMKNFSQLLGGGTISSDRGTSWNTSNPRYGILMDCSTAKVELGTIQYFEYGVYLRGKTSSCTCYNSVNVHFIKHAQYGIMIYTYDTGCVNQNYIHFDRMGHYNTSGITTFGIYMGCDYYNRYANSEKIPNTNRFSGSIESYTYGVRLFGMYNRLDGLRLENCNKLILIENPYDSRPDVNGYVTKYNTWLSEYGGVDEDGIQGTRDYQTISAFGVRYYPMYINASNQIIQGKTYSLYNEGQTYSYAGYVSGSDKKFKKDIKKTENAFDKLRQIDGVTYELLSDTLRNEKTFSYGKKYGVIAQNVQTVIPELVSEIDTIGTLVIEYDGFIPIIIEALKEQEKKLKNKKMYLIL